MIISQQMIKTNTFNMKISKQVLPSNLQQVQSSIKTVTSLPKMLQVTINLSIILELRAKSICALWTKSNSNYTKNKIMSQESILHIYSEVILQWVQD